jgi:hypothetical protein
VTVSRDVCLVLAEQLVMQLERASSALPPHEFGAHVREALNLARELRIELRFGDFEQTL